MMDQCQAGGGEGKGEAVQRKASWTARDTKRKNKCCWTGLHTANFLIERNEEHIRHYQNNTCSYLKTDAASRNEKVVITTW